MENVTWKYLASNPGSVIVDKIVKLSKSWFLHLLSGNNESNYFIGLLK